MFIVESYWVCDFCKLKERDTGKYPGGWVRQGAYHFCSMKCWNEGPDEVKENGS